MDHLEASAGQAQISLFAYYLQHFSATKHLGSSLFVLGRFLLPRRPQDDPETVLPRRPNTTPRRPKTAPRRPQDGPRRAQDNPRQPQDGPSHPQDSQDNPKGPKTAPRPDQNAQNKLKWPKMAILTISGINYFWTTFGAILKIYFGIRSAQEGSR